jgi:integrase/recombinase XerD
LMFLPQLIGGGMTNYSIIGETRVSWLGAYENYLTKVLGVAPATRTSYLLIAGRLLAHIFKDRNVNRSMFAPSAIMEFVAADAAPRKRQGPGTTVAATRSFLRFLISHGIVSPHVETIIPHMWRPRHAALPERLNDSEIQKVLQLANDGTKNGFRNFALVLLFARLGLRADEAARLSLDDIDWVNGHILIRAGKTRRERKLPLSQVTRLLARAGIFRSSCGPHLFRHTLASSMVNHGATFKEIADVLGHQALVTTAVYAKLDLKTLAKIALPWPRM